MNTALPNEEPAAVVPVDVVLAWLAPLVEKLYTPDCDAPHVLEVDVPQDALVLQDVPDLQEVPVLQEAPV